MYQLRRLHSVRTFFSRRRNIRSTGYKIKCPAPKRSGKANAIQAFRQVALDFLSLSQIHSHTVPLFSRVSAPFQAPGQVTGQGTLHPEFAASLPGMAAIGGMMGQGMGPARAPAAQAKPPIVGTPTFCLLVKNMFDPMTETDEGWELDIKEEMEEVRA